MDIAEPPARKPAMAKIGRQILRLRLYWGWSQAELGRRAKLSQSTISRLERGVQRGISTGRLAQVMEALRVGEVTFDRPPTVPQTNPRDHAPRRPVAEGGIGGRPPARLAGADLPTPAKRFAWEVDDDDAA